MTRQNKFRHEYKHTINLLDYHTVKRRIEAIAELDENAGNNGRYHVRSLYFDNVSDKALKEKLYGLPNREKFRIRIYNGSAGIIKLEKKSKTRGLTNKRSAALTVTEAERIIKGDTQWMSDSSEPVIKELYSKMTTQGLKPRTLVDYWREAYVYPFGNVRVTFDFDVRTGLYSTGLFEGEPPTFSVSERGIILLEIKYDNYLPDIIRDLIQTNTRRTEAFSKYAACRIYG